MAETNPNSRLEAFSDGVFAIAITLLIIDIKIPSTEKINSTTDLWIALSHILPSVFAFLLSFTIILITWVNHHGRMKFVGGSSSAFIFANGFLLLTIAFFPFPTALLGEYLLTDHSSPAVVLYVATMAFQAFAWILFTGAGLKLARTEQSAYSIRTDRKYAYFASEFYSLCAVIAFWFPLTIAVITTITWIFWLILAIRLKHE